MLCLFVQFSSCQFNVYFDADHAFDKFLEFWIQILLQKHYWYNFSSTFITVRWMIYKIIFERISMYPKLRLFALWHSIYCAPTTLFTYFEIVQNRKDRNCALSLFSKVWFEALWFRFLWPSFKSFLSWFYWESR